MGIIILFLLIFISKLDDINIHIHFISKPKYKILII